MLLIGQSLYQAVCYYIRSRHPFNINTSFTNFLAELVVIDINILKLSIKLRVTFSK